MKKMTMQKVWIGWDHYGYIISPRKIKFRGQGQGCVCFVEHGDEDKPWGPEAVTSQPLRPGEQVLVSGYSTMHHLNIIRASKPKKARGS